MDYGLICGKQRVSIAKLPAKGYLLFLALDLGLDGQEVRWGTSLARIVRPTRWLPLTVTQRSSAYTKKGLRTMTARSGGMGR